MNIDRLRGNESFDPDILKAFLVKVELSIRTLLDVRTKTKARHAPLAVFVVVVFAVLIYLATQRL